MGARWRRGGKDIVGYNGQVAVDTKNQLIVAQEVPKSARIAIDSQLDQKGEYRAALKET